MSLFPHLLGADFTIMPDGDSPYYSFDAFTTCRLQGGCWMVAFKDSALRDHFVERASEVGFADVTPSAFHPETAAFLPMTESITAMLILLQRLVSDIEGAADAYHESHHEEHSLDY